jgi:hypothetical protein
MDGKGDFGTEDQVIARIWHLAASQGIWPGYIKTPAGRYRLTYDPDRPGHE